MISPHNIFITGATGYLGTALATELLARGHHVRALARPASVAKLPRGVEPVVGDALVASTFASKVAPSDTLVHLVGTPHPGPAKAAQFRSVDLPSIVASIAASKSAGVHLRHLIYVSVAHPAPVMQAYIDVRIEGERLIRESGIDATILRPWYVLGPGHRWPYLLLPLYALSACFPGWRESAQRLGLVTRHQMVGALVDAVEHPADGIRILDVPAIRTIGGAQRQRPQP